jgi:phosphatidylglycerol lysyltransferase
MKTRKRANFHVITVFASVFVSALIVALLHGSRGLSYHAVMHHLRGTPINLIWLAVLLTALSYLALIARDFCALTYADLRVPAPDFLLASFCASALGNAVGLGTFTGSAVRSRVYGVLGVGPQQIRKIMSFINLMFGVGLAVSMAASATLASGAAVRSLGFPPAIIHAVAAAILIAALLVTLICARCRVAVRFGVRTVSAPSLTLAVTQIVIGVIDLAAAGAALWALLPSPRPEFFTFTAIFCAATGLGVISRIPSGLGIFDLVIFGALAKFVSPDRVVAALLLYRAVYFVLPVLLAAASLAGFELRSAAPQRRSVVLQRIQTGASSLAPLFLTAITFAVGAMLIVSGATPAVDWRLALLQSALPLWAVESSHLLATLAGVLLLFVAHGLYDRLDGAWWCALFIALANVGLSLAKGLAFAETAAVLFLIFLLLSTRRQFTRPAAFLRQPFTFGWFLAVLVVIAAATGVLLFAFRDVPYRREIWWQFEFDAQASRSLRAILGASILALALSLRQLLRAAPGRPELPSAEDLARAELIIRAQPRSAAMLALMGDKSLLFSESRESFLMYAKRGRSWIALLDPVGPRGEWPDLVRRMVELADTHGGRVAHYQILPENLPIYLEGGFRVVKIGEEAIIDLNQFALEGAPRYGLRQALKRAEREEVSFEFLRGDRIDLDPLTQISDAWLTGRRSRERRFSVAAFEPHFIARQLIGLSRQRGIPIGFLTCMTTGCKAEATLGLMRQAPAAPSYLMEFMITRMAMELKTENFASLSLGMAPLAGLVRTPLSPRWHRMARLLWEHGEPIYNFRGLRSFKNKFRPRWESRYLAAAGAVGPLMHLADVAVLAGGRRQRRSSAA